MTVDDNITPPHDDSAERSVLGSVMLARDAGLADVLQSVMGILSPDHLYGPRNQAIFRAMRDLYGDGEPIDIITVGDRLGDKTLEECGGHTYLMELLQAVPHAAHAEHYAGIVIEKAARRRLLVELRDLASQTRDPGIPLEDLEPAIAKLGEDQQTGKAGAILASSLRETLDPRSREQLRVYPIGAGFEPVDLSPGKVVLLGAAPGTGKTALISQWTTDAMLADLTLRAFIANVEMSPSVQLDRQLARLSDVPLTAIRHRGPSLARVWGERLDHGLATLDGILDRLAFARNPHVIEDIRREARPHAPDILVIDYVQKISTRDRRDSAREQVNAVMTQARQIADAGVCVLVVAAVSRQKSSTGSGYGGLTLASFRESGDLEFSADDAWVMEKTADGDRGSHEVRLRCLKARHGELAELDLAFDGHHQQFSVIDPNGVEDESGDMEAEFDMAEAAY